MAKSKKVVEESPGWFDTTLYVIIFLVIGLVIGTSVDNFISIKKIKYKLDSVENEVLSNKERLYSTVLSLGVLEKRTVVLDDRLFGIMADINEIKAEVVPSSKEVVEEPCEKPSLLDNTKTIVVELGVEPPRCK